MADQPQHTPNWLHSITVLLLACSLVLAGLTILRQSAAIKSANAAIEAADAQLEADVVTLDKCAAIAIAKAEGSGR